MALGVIDFYSPVAKGFAAGFFCGDFGGEVDFWGENQVRQTHYRWFDFAHHRLGLFGFVFPA